jgi:S-adenosylmethionine:diacylglycerol 3-amino-3-carboxypropyl transferase
MRTRCWRMPDSILEGTGVSVVRYAQVWEDADVLLAGLDVRPGDACVSIASAGDNTLALLTKQPSRVVAIDVSAAQLACLELRVAAYRTLQHEQLLELIGSRPSVRRAALFAQCRPLLSSDARAFWDRRGRDIDGGIGGAGRFERYFALFRQCVLPLIHDRKTVADLLGLRTREAREEFYDTRWNSWRWRFLVRAFFSRVVMSRLGRERAFFQYAEGSLPAAILERTRHALVDLDPSANPYAHWILTGTHGDALPCALRPENFGIIRDNLDRLEWHRVSLEEFVRRSAPGEFDRFNLSDVFEYVSPAHYEALLADIVRTARTGARLAYWNLLAPRSRPESLAARLHPLATLAGSLHASDRAFFYSAFRIEEVVGC